MRSGRLACARLADRRPKGFTTTPRSPGSRHPLARESTEHRPEEELIWSATRGWICANGTRLIGVSPHPALADSGMMSFIAGFSVNSNPGDFLERDSTVRSRRSRAVHAEFGRSGRAGVNKTVMADLIRASTSIWVT